ncbi:MAG TPA: hypothetical protein VKH83_15625 [Methylomirabilota bacterium]|nr:hypothetical protein [Methylomirabilota bacterium]
MASVPEPPAVGQPAPLFSLTSVQGGTVDLAAYRGRANGPNLLQAARVFFGHSPTPYPFVCNPDKRLYAVYGLGDRGALQATCSAVVSFSYAFTRGDTGPQLRGAWLDVMNRNFVRRLHHHAMSALEQGIFLVDRDGVIRHRTVVGPLDPVPRAAGRDGPDPLPGNSARSRSEGPR